MQNAVIGSVIAPRDLSDDAIIQEDAITVIISDRSGAAKGGIIVLQMPFGCVHATALVRLHLK